MSLWKAGVIVAALALVAWCLVGVAVLTSKPENGANIGAGLIALLAMALSAVAESFLIASADRGSWRAVGIAALCAWPLWLALTSNELLDRRDSLILGVLPVGLLVASLVLLHRGWRTQTARQAGLTSP